MLELARPEVRAIHTQPQRFTWGIVDAILGIVMLPFGAWLFLIERCVASIAAIFDR